MSESDQGQASVADAPSAEALEPDAAPAAQPTMPLAAAVLIVVAAVVVALLAVTAVIELKTDRLSGGPPRDPPAPAPAPTTMTISTSKVSFQEYSVSLPTEPFACRGDEPSPTPVFTQYTDCYAVVHRNYGGGQSSWVAQVGVALLADSTGSAGDLPGTTDAVFDAVISTSFSAGDDVTLSKPVSEASPEVNAPSSKAWIQQANANFSIKGLATTSDRVTVVLVELASGKRIAYIADIPSDSDKTVFDALVTSANSISARS